MTESLADGSVYGVRSARSASHFGVHIVQPNQESSPPPPPPRREKKKEYEEEKEKEKEKEKEEEVKEKNYWELLDNKEKKKNK